MSSRVVKWSRGRVLGTAVFFVVVGVVFNALVAALSLCYAPETVRFTGPGVGTPELKTTPTGTASSRLGSLETGLGITTRMHYWYFVAKNGVGVVPVRSTEVGWPMRAFVSPQSAFEGVKTGEEFGAAAGVTSGPTTSSIPSFFRAQPNRVLPTRVRPLAVAVNSLFFAALPASILFAWATVRARRRRTGGRCVACGYPLRDLGRCPECGWARLLTRLRSIFAGRRVA